jgi:CubicO group peptidase (beta-lactamase class C family)
VKKQTFCLQYTTLVNMNRRFAALVFVLFLISCQQASNKAPVLSPEGSADAAGFSPERLSRLDSGMNNWVKNKWVNGAVALVARKGKIVFHKSFGYNDPDTNEPLDKNGIFRIASQTKAITTVAAMMLWEEGKYGLDDPVSKYIPTFAQQTVIDKFNLKDTTYTTVPAKRPITIRDILTHTSGIGYAGIGTPEANALYAKNRITGGVGLKTTEKIGDAMTRLGSVPLLFQPGERWMYGVNTDLLGYLVEIWSGMTLEQYFTEKIFKPLGMNDTYFNVPQEKASRLVNFFMDSDGSGIKKQDVVWGALDMKFPITPHSYFSGGGGLSSTITDYAILLQMLLNEGEYNGKRYLARNTVRLMTTNQIGDLFSTGENKFGFGFAITTENSSRLTPSQAGTYAWGGAFSTTYWVDPKEQMLVLLYRQMWGPHIADTDRQFKPLVYQALND